jgi:hypothetical protein
VLQYNEFDQYYRLIHQSMTYLLILIFHYSYSTLI